MFFTGIAIFAGVAALLSKLRRRHALRALTRSRLDVTVSAVTLAVHWGTFPGVMAATVAGLLTSIGTSAVKRLFGYIRAGQYFPGIFHVDVTA